MLIIGFNRLGCPRLEIIKLTEKTKMTYRKKYST